MKVLGGILVDAGPIQITADKKESPIAGGLMLAAGLVLLIKRGGA